jgi:hypothetical protein
MTMIFVSCDIVTPVPHCDTIRQPKSSKKYCANICQFGKKFLLSYSEMLKYYFVIFFEINYWKNSVDSNWNLNKVEVENRPSFDKKYFSTENMCGIFFWPYYVFGLSISLEICPNQHFLGVTITRYELLKADFVPCCTFFANFPCSFFKNGNPYKHCWHVSANVINTTFLFMTFALYVYLSLLTATFT